MARPQRIVLVRHGESEGNADDTVYEREPDHALRLTPSGVSQAEETGVRLRELFGQERVSTYVSPYRRTHETFRAFGLDPERVRVRRSPGCVSRTGGTGRTATTCASRRRTGTRTAISSTGSRRGVRRRCLRPGRVLPGESAPQFRGTGSSAERPAGHARSDHAALLHALVPLVGRRVRGAGESWERRDADTSAGGGRQVHA